MMHMEGGRHNDGDHCHYQSLYSDRTGNRGSRSPMSPVANSFTGEGAGAGGVGFIEHPVSKMDTLAGVAIKYGVEVADIKRINGLVSDLQMFALKSLRIPTPGRHPPSPCLSNGSNTPGRSCLDQSPSRRLSDLFDSFQSLKKSPHQKVSPAMSSLQGYYGLQPPNGNTANEGSCEMAFYRTRSGAHNLEDESLTKASSTSNRPLSRHRKCRSLANGFMTQNGEHSNEAPLTDAGEMDSDKSNEKLIRRRQKSEADFSARTEDNSSGGGFSAITGKGLALRPKSVARNGTAGGEMEGGWLNPIGLGESSVADGFGVRKSSSTSNLQDQEHSSLSIWATSKWNFKQDLQALSNVAIARPIFDGLPKPITGRKNKAALD